MNLETYEEKTIFSTIMPSETVVDLSFSHNGDYVLITTQYKCVEFNLITGEEMIVARSAGQERFLYGNYSGKWIEVTVTEGSEEGLPTRCEFYSKVAKYAGFEFSNLDSSKWNLVWSDEFPGDSVDTNKWSFTIGGGGFGNNEQQYYTDSTENAYIENGCLVLNAIQESNGEENYTSAKLSSTSSWTYGRYEFRAKLPGGTGLWPAIWMLPKNINVYGGEWPICGEIDIMEYMGSDRDTVLGTLHYGNPWVYNTGYYDINGSFEDDFHDFVLEWLPGEFRWYVDGNLYQIQQDWYSADSSGTYSYPAPFDQEFYLMLNLAVGGFFPGDPNPADWTSTKFYIDYVRVYEYGGDLTPDSGSSSTQTPNVNLLQNSDFTTDYAGWTTWSENGAVFSVADSTLKADIYTTLPNTWSTQFYQNVDVYSSTTYRISFRAKSSVSRPITIGVEGVNNAALFNSTFTATPEWQTYTYDFAPSVSCGGAKLLFFLGNVEGSQNVEHTVSFDDITLIPLPDDIVTNGNFVNDLTSWSTWTENGSTYSVDAGEQCFVANIPTTLPNAWSAQLYQVIDVPASGSYRVTFKAKASMNREIRLALEKDGQSPLMDETMSVSADWTNYSYDFTVSSAASGVKLVFMLGNVGTTENMAHTISIDDISLYKVS